MQQLHNQNINVMTIIEEIRLHFATFTDGLRKLDSVPSEYPAYTIRYNGEYGVVIDYDYEKDICEESTNAMISTRKISLAGGQKKCLLLTCYDEEYRNEFALLCETFVTPGEGGALRDVLLSDPLAWWDRWIGLLGNRKTKKRCYDIIAEMVVLYKLFSLDKTCIWAAQERGSHDIESKTASYEVKSTIKKSDLCVTISSQHQLFGEKDLFLAFVRLEKSYEGISINDMEKKLIEIGYDKDVLQNNYLILVLLKAQGLVMRNIRFWKLENIQLMRNSLKSRKTLLLMVNFLNQ